MNEEIATGAVSKSDLVPRFRDWLDQHDIEGGWIALELGDPLADAANRSAYPTVRQAAEADGLIAHGAWRTRGFTAQDAHTDVTSLAAQLFIAEGEIPAEELVDGTPHANAQAQNWNALVNGLAPLEIECAVATSFGPFQSYSWENGRWILRPDRTRAEPLIDAGWYCLPYVYPAEHAGITVRDMTFYASHYGREWAEAEPVLGVYGGYTVDDPAFDGKDSCPGYSLWDAGEVL